MSGHIPDESSPLFPQPAWALAQHVAPAIARRLYLSHFLSMWNSRVFEFGAVLYLAALFPGTLLPVSTYALMRGLSAVVFASAVGEHVDHGQRLHVARGSIVGQRVAVAASCLVFYLLALELPRASAPRLAMLALVTLVACVEKLCSIINLIAIERDWLVVVASDKPEALTALNAQMRRIDLLCKLFGPLFIALIESFSIRAAIITNFSINVVSIPVEYIAIARVYHDVPALHEPYSNNQDGPRQHESPRTWQRPLCWLQTLIAHHKLYLHHGLFLPSFAAALLHLTVLSFGGQMTTYLLSAGYSSIHVSIARTLSVLAEMAATWLAPWLMSGLGPLRAGLWLSSWQVTMLVAGVAVFCVFENTPLVSASGLVIGTIVSRLGLRGFGLCVQFLIQQVRAVFTFSWCCC
ncbi:hypothetical protein CDD81_8034 [Ophiocordyceps australis]|uniref:Solute carrier family 40 member n=1 Tax=Ophiocordyceps australis TaxID=1399860 RepID=A0A2C5X8T1_9HYPO|nr:hypothetical protein CDD81_8034 [Ophiocordyceps australis]